VIAAVQRIAPTLPLDARVVTILPDRGERYMDLVYDDAWVAQHRHEPDPLADEPATPQMAREIALVPAP
jgi:hypothetical protein